MNNDMYQEMGFPPILSDSTLIDYILEQIHFPISAFVQIFQTSNPITFSTATCHFNIFYYRKKGGISFLFYLVLISNLW